jgi:hypothetical protein
MFFSLASRAGAAAATLLVLAGCSGATVTPQGRDGSSARAARAARYAPILSPRGVPFAGTPEAWAAAIARPAAAPDLSAETTEPEGTHAAKAWGASLFVSDFGATGNGFVYQFASKKNGKIINKIADVVNPQGMDVDPHGNLWVASTGSSTVREYPPGKYVATATLNDSGEYPFSVAFCPNGTAYVMNSYDLSYLPGNIEIYASGSTVPTGVVPDANIYNALFGACDANNVLWFDYNDYNFYPKVASFDGLTVTEYGSLGLTAAGGIRVGTTDGAIGIVDPYVGVELFKASNIGAGPYLTLRGKAPNTLGEPISFSFDKKQANVYVSDVMGAGSGPDAAKITLKNVVPFTLGAGTLSTPIDAFDFPPGNT